VLLHRNVESKSTSLDGIDVAGAVVRAQPLVDLSDHLHDCLGFLFHWRNLS